MAPVLPCDKFKSVHSFGAQQSGVICWWTHACCCNNTKTCNTQNEHAFYLFIFLSLWWPPVMLSFDVLQHMLCSQEEQKASLVQRRQTSLTLASFTDPSYHPWTDRQRRGLATLKQNQFSVCPVKGGRCLQIAVQKICPSFPQEKRSFHFINSRLKRNYLPTDLNHQQKDNRTKSSFFFSH